MGKLFWKPAWFMMGLLLLATSVSSKSQTTETPGFLIIASTHELLRITTNGPQKITELNGQILSGSDADIDAYLQTPGTDGQGSRRLLIVEQKTGAIIADREFEGFRPVLMKAMVVDRLVVRSKEFLVYVPLFEQNYFGVMELNWKTGATRRLPQSAVGTNRYEITALNAVPPGIAVERGPQLIIFDTTAQKPILSFNHRDDFGQPPGQRYPGFVLVPDFGIVQISKEGISRLTEKDFSTKIANPVIDPDTKINKAKWARRIGHNIRNVPCLIWPENEPGVSPDSRTFSILVVYDLESKKEIIRKSLGTDFNLGYVTDDSGENIYLFKGNKIFRFETESQTLSPFADLGDYKL